MGIEIFGMDLLRALVPLGRLLKETLALGGSIFLLGAFEEGAGQLIDHHIIPGEIELAVARLILRVEDRLETGDRRVEMAILGIDESGKPGHGPPRRASRYVSVSRGAGNLPRFFGKDFARETSGPSN